jgi:hypothetical protein
MANTYKNTLKKIGYNKTQIKDIMDVSIREDVKDLIDITRAVYMEYLHHPVGNQENQKKKYNNILKKMNSVYSKASILQAMVSIYSPDEKYKCIAGIKWTKNNLLPFLKDYSDDENSIIREIMEASIPGYCTDLVNQAKRIYKNHFPSSEYYGKSKTEDVKKIRSKAKKIYFMAFMLEGKIDAYHSDNNQMTIYKIMLDDVRGNLLPFIRGKTLVNA